MLEENQNVWMRFNQRQSSLRDRANNMVWLQNNARQQQMDEFSTQKDNEIINNYSAWLRATDHWVSQDCTTAARIGLVAEWIRKYFKRPENWGKNYYNVEDIPLVDAYKADNPDSEEAIWQFVLDDSQVCDPNPLYEQLGLYLGEDEEEKSDSSIGANIAQSVIDIPMNLAKLPFNLIDKWTAWVAKQFSDDDEAIDSQLQNNLQKTEDFATLPWVDREDLSYQIPNFIWELWTTVATSLIPWVWEAKWAEFATKYPKFAKLIKLAWGADEVYKKYPWIAKFLKWWATWVKDITVMNALEWEWTTPLEAIEWRLAWWIIEKWAWALKKLSAYIQTNWLLKPTDADNIIKKLKSRWELWDKLRDITWLADFMTENWLAWTKQQVYEKAMKLWEDKKNILMDLIKLADKSDAEKWITHSLPEADEAIDLLKKTLEKSDGSPIIPRKEQLQFFNEMIAKRWIGSEEWLFNNVWKYSLSDLERLKEELDDLYKIYTDAWSVLERQQAANWHEERKAIKNYIEKEMKKRWMWDVSQINNEISTAYEIANWVSDKALSDSTKSAMSSVANTITDWAWPAAWLYLWASALNDFREWNITWWIIKVVWTYVLNNTFIKTHLWSLLNRITWTSRNEVQKWIDSEWRTALSNDASEEVAKIINSDSSLKKKAIETIKQYLTRLPKETWTILWQKWVEAASDYISE